MNNNSKVLIFIIMLISILVSVTAISAADTGNNTQSTVQTDQTQLSTDTLAASVQSDESSEKINKNIKTQQNLYVSSKATGNGHNVNSTTTMQNALKHVENNGTIHLVTNKNAESDTYNLNKEININKNTVNNKTTHFNIIGENGKTIIFNGHKHGIFNISSGYTVTIKNIVITNATAEDIPAINSKGTLILENNTFTDNGNEISSEIVSISNSKATIRNNEFVNNTASSGTGITAYNSSITVTNNNFTGNAADSGGAISSYDISHVLIDNNRFINNTAVDTYGGAICVSDSIVNITRNTFISNRADSGGAITVLASDTLIKSNYFYNNSAGFEGGAIYYNNDSQDDLEIGIGEIIDNTFKNNTVDHTVDYDEGTSGQSYGGVIRNHGIILFKNNTVINNSANFGGAIHNDGIIEIRDNHFTDNSAVATGGVLYDEGTTVIFNNTFTRNHAGLGGALHTENNTEIYNNTFNSNYAGYDGGAVAPGGNNTIHANIFINNSAPFGGAISADNSTIINNTFINNNATVNGRTVSLGYSNDYVNRVIIRNNRFINNTKNSDVQLFDISDNTTEAIRQTSIISQNNTYTGNLLNTTILTGNITLPRSNTVAVNNYTLTITIPKQYNSTVRSGTVKVIINGRDYKSFNVVNSSANISIDTNAFTNTHNSITLRYISSNSDYTNSSYTYYYNKTLNKTSIHALNSTAKLGNTVILRANITSSDRKVLDGDKVAVKINDKTFGKTYVKNGTISYNLYLSPDKFSMRDYKVTFVYGGNRSYAQNRVNSVLTVTGYNPVINISVINASYIKDHAVMTVKVSNATGFNARSGSVGFKLNNITYKIGGKPYITRINNGTAVFNFEISRKMLNKYNITITYSGNGQFYGGRSTFTNAFTITNKTRTICSVSVVNNTLGQNTTLTAKFRGSDGKLVTSGKVAVKINGKTFGHTYINNGTAVFKLYLDPAKFSGRNYNLTFKYGGNNYHSEVTSDSLLSINKYTSTFIYNTITAKRNTTANITVNITSNENPGIIATGKVGIKINGRTYMMDNSSYIVKPVNGTATFSIPVDSSMNNSNLTFTYSGDSRLSSLKNTFTNGLIIDD